jgi:hypothetical protein
MQSETETEGIEMKASEMINQRCECGNPVKFFHVNDEFVGFCDDMRDLLIQQGENPQDIMPVEEED